MIHWITANNFRDEGRSALNPIQTTYKALLSSIIADGDVVTDWIYYVNILRSEEGIPQWLLILQLASCVFGTLSWLSVASDGRFVYWIKFAVLWSIIISIYIIIVPIGILSYILNEFITKKCLGEDNLIVDVLTYGFVFGMEENVLKPLKKNAKHKNSFSSSTLLIFGILLEDIPQLVVTFLIEDQINSDDPTGKVSDAAKLSLVFSIFDIAHKFVEALDLLSDVHNAGYAYKKWIKAYVYSLAAAGGNRVISTSYGTVKLWNTAKGKFKSIRKFNCDMSRVRDAVAVGSSKVIAACDDKKIRVFDFETGEPRVSLTGLDFQPRCIALSHDSTSFLTSGYDASTIQRYNIETDEWLSATTYNKKATQLTFLDNATFVSFAKGSNNAFVWNVDKSEPIRTIVLEHGDDTFDGNKVMTMSATMFVISDGHSIKTYELDNNEWTYKSTFKEHTDRVTSLTKVNDSLFVSTSRDKTAKLWDITMDSKSKFTFRGHRTYIYSSVYLEEQKAIATGDWNGNIAVWSISKYLENNEDGIQNNATNTQDDNNTSNDDNIDQNPIIEEP